MFRWLRSLFARRAPGAPAPPRMTRDYRQLLNRVFGDPAAAERLIAYELKRSPDLTRDQAVHRALDRLEYERSR